MRNYWDVEKKFVNELARRIDISTKWGRAAVTVFNDDGWLAIPFGKCYTYECFEKEVSALEFKGGSTNIRGGLEKALDKMFTEDHGMRPTSNKYLVLITDGNGNDPGVDYSRYKKQFQDRTITRIVIGVGDGVNEHSLKELVDDESYYYAAADFRALLKTEFISNIKICNGKFSLNQCRICFTILCT